MGSEFDGGFVDQSLRVRDVIRRHFHINGASAIRELPPEQFCRHGYVLGKTAEDGFGNEMYKILTSAALSVMLNRSLIIGQTRHILGKVSCEVYVNVNNQKVSHQDCHRKCLGITLPERRSTVVSSYLNPSNQNDNSFLLLRRGKKFGRIVKLKLSHFFLFFVSLFFFSCIFSGHKLLFHGSEILPHFEQNPYMKNHMFSSEIDIGLNKSNIEKPPGSKKRNKHLPCEVALAESVDRILEPQEYLNFTRFSLGFVETETYDKPRFGGHQTLNERERSFSATNQTVHCGFVKGANGFHQGTGFDLSEKDRAYMKNCVVSVSSCIFGSSDFLRRPASKKISEFSKGNVCFVMFVDEQTLSKLASEGHVPDNQGFVGLWKTVVVRNLPYTDMRKTGKVPKFLSHRLFPSSRYSIWIDSKMRLTTDPMLIIDYFLWRTKSEFAISNHYDRHCVWDEVLQNKRLNKYNHSAIDEQFMFYRSDGLKKFDPSDPHSPLPSYVPEGSFIVRAHTPMSNLFTCLWFNEVDRFTSRDQLSFAYTYLKLQRLNPDRPLRLNMFKDCERRSITKLFHHRVDSSPPAKWIK